MDKWSANRAFTMTKTLGSDATITKAVTKRQGTPAGDSGDQRWVFELVKSEKLDSDTYHLGFDWGTTSRVKFNRVRIQRMAEG